jgi:hypothetical protein
MPPPTEKISIDLIDSTNLAAANCAGDEHKKERRKYFVRLSVLNLKQ